MAATEVSDILKRIVGDAKMGNRVSKRTMSGAAIALVVLWCATAPVRADPLCAGRGSVDSVKNIPQSLVSFVDTLFGQGAASETVYRCMNETIYVCYLPSHFSMGCDKPDTKRFNPEVAKFCLENPNEAIGPGVVAGHATIYAWKCARAKPIVTYTEPLDERGFRGDMWTAVAGAK